MRKKVGDILRRSMLERLARDHAELRVLDARNDTFNGSFGFRLGRWNGSSTFLAVQEHDEEDSFRVLVAWGPGEDYPAHPFRDLAADAEVYLRSRSAEVALAHLSDEALPFEFDLDPQASAGKSAREAIGARLQRGEVVTPEEWLLTLQPARCKVEATKGQADAVSEQIATALRGLKTRMLSPR